MIYMFRCNYHLSFCVCIVAKLYAKQKHLWFKKGEANQKQQLPDYTFMQLKALISAKAKN